jgi:hypothetical protein
MCIIKVDLPESEIEKIILGINSPTGWHGYSVQMIEKNSFRFAENGRCPFMQTTVSIKNGEIWVPGIIHSVITDALIDVKVKKYSLEVRAYESPEEARCAFEAS